MSKDQSLTKNDFRNKGWNALKGTATIREGLEKIYEEVVAPLLEENKRLKEQVKELEDKLKEEKEYNSIDMGKPLPCGCKEGNCEHLYRLQDENAELQSRIQELEEERKKILEITTSESEDTGQLLFDIQCLITHK